MTSSLTESFGIILLFAIKVLIVYYFKFKLSSWDW